MTATAQRVQLALQDGVKYRSVIAELDDNILHIHAHDMGPIVEQTWNEDDYEFGIKIALADLPKFAFALIVHHYRHDLDAVDRLKDLAGANGIEANWWSWI